MFGDSSTRAHDHQGEPFQTKCFEFSLASRPQDHLLICGHQIQTYGEREKCGSNCAPSATAERKVYEPAFACPVPNCAQDRNRQRERSKVFLPKPGSTRARYRPCNLSQDLVYGAKVEPGINTHRTYRTRGERAEGRKRSRSPDRPGQRESHDMDPAEAINILAANDEAFKYALANFSGPGVRPKKDGRLKTRKEFELEFKDKAVVRALNNIQVLEPAEIQQKINAAKKRELALNPNFGAADKEFGEEIKKTKPEDLVGAGVDTGLDCSACGDRAHDIAFKCRHCLEFVFCNSCFMRDRDIHPQDDKHIFDVITPSNAWDRADDGETEDTKDPEVPHEPGTFCKCETTSKEYLIECDGDDCHTLFHPGCFGRGIFENIMYEQENGDYYRKKDKNAHRNSRKAKVWLCEACNDAIPVESEQSRARSARVIARARDRAANAQQNATKKMYSSHEQAAKDAELKMARTEQERTAIEAKWEEIADEEMDVDQDDQAIDIPTFPMGPIAFHFKLQPE